MYPSFRILIITDNLELSQELQEYLQSRNYSLEVAASEESALEKFNESPFNLLICQDKLKDKSGFQLYKKLEPELEKRNSAFFIVLSNYSKEDVQLGLELGIDNFIFTPVDSTSLRNKVDKLYNKSFQFNYYETPRFLEQFYSSPIPMFFSKDFEIQETNRAFTQLFEQCKINPEDLYFNDLFELNGNQQNHLNLRKLENGLIDHCWLDGVECVLQPKQKFSLYKSVVGSRDGKRMLAILMPQCRHHAGGLENEDCPVYGTCLKNQDISVSANDADLQLTPRETEIFNLSAAGVPLKQIAARLQLSQRTVEKHRSNIMRKTETHSMMEAILKIRRKEV